MVSQFTRFYCLILSIVLCSYAQLLHCGSLYSQLYVDLLGVQSILRQFLLVINFMPQNEIDQIIQCQLHCLCIYECFHGTAFPPYNSLILMQADTNQQFQKLRQLRFYLVTSTCCYATTPSSRSRTCANTCVSTSKTDPDASNSLGAICQHHFMSKLFKESIVKSHPITVLECLNLLLANTQLTQELVYFFSQPSLHSFLFGSSSILDKDTEVVEYYVQLLKTIILKIELPANQSLIKLFCNNKYPSFPLLTHSILLATRPNCEELVRVTARQCILVLINIIRDKQEISPMLCELSMVCFFYEITHTLSQEMHSYLMDLVEALHGNQGAQLMLFNCLTNSLLQHHLEEPLVVLRFMRMLQELDSESERKEELLHRNVEIMLRIVGKLMFNRYVSNSYFSTHILLSTHSLPQPGLNAKLLLQHFNKLKSLKSPPLDIAGTLQQLTSYNSSSDNKEFLQLKDSQKNKNKNGNNTGILNAVLRKFSNEYATTNYLRSVSLFAGVRLEIGKQVTIGNVAPESALYIAEALNQPHKNKNKSMFGQTLEDTELRDINLNKNRGKFKLDIELVKAVIELMKLPLEAQLPYKRFLLHLKVYLQSAIGDHLLEPESNLFSRVTNIMHLTELCDLFNLSCDGQCRQRIQAKLASITQQIQCVLSENGFKGLSQYIMRQYWKNCLQLTLKEPQPEGEPTKQKLIDSQNEYRQHCVILSHQFLKYLLKPDLNTVNQIFQQKWKQHFHETKQFVTTKQGDKLGVIVNFQGTFYGSPSCQLILRACHTQYTVLFQVYLYGKCLKSLSLRNKEIRQNLVETKMIHIGEDVEPISLRSVEEAESFIQEFTQSRFKIEELATIAIIEYFSTNSSLIQFAQETKMTRKERETPS